MEFRLLGPLEVLGDDGAPSARRSRGRGRCCALLLAAERRRLDGSADRRDLGRIAARQRSERAPGPRPRPAPARSAPNGSRPARPATCCASSRTSSTSSAFDALVARGRRRATEALALWRGPALAGPRRRAVRASRTRHGSRMRGSPRSRHASTQTSRPGGTTCLTARARSARRGRTRTASASARSRCSRSTAPAGRPTRSPRTATREPRSTSSASSRRPSCARSSSGSFARTRASTCRSPGAAPAPASPARTCLAARSAASLELAAVSALLDASRHPPRHPHRAWWNGQDAPRAGAGRGRAPAVGTPSSSTSRP